MALPINQPEQPSIHLLYKCKHSQRKNLPDCSASLAAAEYLVAAPENASEAFENRLEAFDAAWLLLAARVARIKSQFLRMGLMMLYQRDRGERRPPKPRAARSEEVVATQNVDAKRVAVRSTAGLII